MISTINRHINKETLDKIDNLVLPHLRSIFNENNITTYINNVCPSIILIRITENDSNIQGPLKSRFKLKDKLKKMGFPQHESDIFVRASQAGNGSIVYVAGLYSGQNQHHIFSLCYPIRVIYPLEIKKEIKKEKEEYISHGFNNSLIDLWEYDGPYFLP